MINVNCNNSAGRYYPHFPDMNIEVICSGHTASEWQRQKFTSGFFDFTDFAPSQSIVRCQINKLIKSTIFI